MRACSNANLAASLLALGFVAFVACSSDSTSSSGDAGASDASSAEGGGNKLPSCVTEGFQCQPKGCNAGYEPLNGYDCGSASASCCGKSVAPFDAGVDARDAKTSD